LLDAGDDKSGKALNTCVTATLTQSVGAIDGEDALLDRLEAQRTPPRQRVAMAWLLRGATMVNVPSSEAHRRARESSESQPSYLVQVIRTMGALIIRLTDDGQQRARRYFLYGRERASCPTETQSSSGRRSSPGTREARRGTNNPWQKRSGENDAGIRGCYQRAPRSQPTTPSREDWDGRVAIRRSAAKDARVRTVRPTRARRAAPQDPPVRMSPRPARSLRSRRPLVHAHPVRCRADGELDEWLHCQVGAKRGTFESRPRHHMTSNRRNARVAE